MMNRSIVLWLSVMAALTAQQADAAVIVGGSTLMSQSDADQLQTWLGAGNITLTNVFTHTLGDGKTSWDFHAAVDGKGPTFSLIQVLPGTYAGLYSVSSPDLSYYTLTTSEVIGGYDPQSWSSIGDYNYTPNDADRTAFIFNLTTMQIQRQHLNPDPIGVWQTFNASSAGPTFGGGHDIEVGPDLSSDYRIMNYSYGPPAYTQDILTDFGQLSTNGVNYGTIEVFTISPTVPEPSTLIIWSLLGSLAVGLAWWRQRKAA